MSFRTNPFQQMSYNYQYKQNNYSDSQFLRDSVAETKKSKESVTLITDGAYGGGDNSAFLLFYHTFLIFCLQSEKKIYFFPKKSIIFRGYVL